MNSYKLLLCTISFHTAIKLGLLKNTQVTGVLGLYELTVTLRADKSRDLGFLELGPPNPP